MRRSLPSLFGILVLAAFADGCSKAAPASSSTTTGTASAGGGGHPATTTSTGQTGSGAGGGGLGGTTTADSGAAGGGWPTGNPGWKPVTFKNPCAAEVATVPGNAVPRLRWRMCGAAFPGCEAVVVDWTAEGFSIARPFVAPHGDGHRVGVQLRDVDHRNHGALFDEAGLPVAVWRIPEISCGSIAGPMPHEEHVWLGIQAGQSPSGYAVGTYKTLSTGLTPLAFTSLAQDFSSTDSTLALQSANGMTLHVYDRLGNRFDTYYPEPGLAYDHPFAVADSVLVRYAPAFATFEARIWNRSTHAIETLISALPSDDILDIKGDGQTLVWIRGPHGQDREGYYLPGELWTSPFATTKGAVKGTKRRAAPLVGEVLSTAGEGYYALYGAKEAQIHVYRLSDMRHWAFGTPPEAADLYDLAYVDSKFVYYRKIGTMFRQALDALGPGDAAP